MKTLRDYLAESKRQYSYRVKIAGEASADFFKAFEKDLARFDVAKFTDPRRTPIHSTLPDFEGITNQEMHIVDVVLNYPANSEQILQMAVSHGINQNCVNVVTTDFDESDVKDSDARQKMLDSNEALLNQPYGADTAEQKAASSDYASSYKTAASNTGSIEHKFAGPATPKAETTNDLPMGEKSPMSKINRPAIPKTGYRT